MSYDSIETFRNLDEYRAAKGGSAGIVGTHTLGGSRPRNGVLDPELPEEWKDRPVVRASDSPALAKRREEADKRVRKMHKRNGTLEQYEAALAQEAERKAERERVEAEARKQLEEEAEEARIERVKRRLVREGEAVPE